MNQNRTADITNPKIRISPVTLPLRISHTARNNRYMDFPLSFIKNYKHKIANCIILLFSNKYKKTYSLPVIFYHFFITGNYFQKRNCPGIRTWEKPAVSPASRLFSVIFCIFSTFLADGYHSSSIHCFCII